MPFLGKRSLQNLSEASWILQKITQRAITKCDFSIIDCYRPEAEQQAAFESGNSKARFGESPHNIDPSEALDCIPYPFHGWEDTTGFTSIKEAFEASRLELISECEIPADYKLEYGQDWGWDSPHIQNKNWKLINHPG